MLWNLMVNRRVQLVSPAAHWMQVAEIEDPSYTPPQTTSFPPGRREMVCPYLGSGRSGMEQDSERGRGKISTFERGFERISKPPITTCPEWSIIIQ